MTRWWCLMAAIVCLIATGPAGAQRGGRGAGEPQGIVRGADQPNQNRWNAKSPWGRTERSAPIAAQKKHPFKIFDNVEDC